MKQIHQASPILQHSVNIEITLAALEHEYRWNTEFAISFIYYF